MIHRFAFLILAFIFVVPACSKKAGEDEAKSGDALLKPDNGYIILLGRGRLIDSITGVSGYESLTLIAGGTVRTFEGLKSPVVSSNGHVAGINESGEVVVYYPDEESPSIFAAVEGDDKYSINGGIGISNSGKRVYQVGIQPVEENGEQRFAIQLVEFDTDHKRITNRVTLHEYSAERFDIDREGITGSLGLPLHVSQNGERVYITSVELDDEKRANAEKSLGVIPYKAPASMGIGVNSYVYSRGQTGFNYYLGYAENDFETLRLEDVSRDGRKSVFVTSGTKLIAFEDGSGAPPEFIASGGACRIGAVRLSPVGSKAGYFTWNSDIADRLNPYTEVNIVSLISKRKDMPFGLNQIERAAFTNDLKYVAYISDSFKSSVVFEDQPFETQEWDAWYLHLVDVITHEDKVIYVNYHGNPPVILDIVAESDEYKDRSKTKPPVNAPGETQGSGGKSLPGKDSREYGTGDGPSISTK